MSYPRRQRSFWARIKLSVKNWLGTNDLFDSRKNSSKCLLLCFPDYLWRVPQMRSGNAICQIVTPASETYFTEIKLIPRARSQTCVNCLQNTIWSYWPCLFEDQRNLVTSTRTRTVKEQKHGLRLCSELLTNSVVSGLLGWFLVCRISRRGAEATQLPASRQSLSAYFWAESFSRWRTAFRALFHGPKLKENTPKSSQNWPLANDR